MPQIRNCSPAACSVWGRPINAEGMVDGNERWIDTLAPGGVGDFPNHSEIMLRDGDKERRGALVAGPIREATYHVGGADGGGSGARCPAAAPRRAGSASWICFIIVCMALLAALLGVALSFALKA